MINLIRIHFFLGESIANKCFFDRSGVRVLVGDILCSWARPAISMGTGKFNAGGNPAVD